MNWKLTNQSKYVDRTDQMNWKIKINKIVWLKKKKEQINTRNDNQCLTEKTQTYTIKVGSLDNIKSREDTVTEKIEEIENEIWPERPK